MTIFEFAEEHNTPYIVMEFLRGIAPRRAHDRQPPLTLDDKLNIVAQLCAACTTRTSRASCIATSSRPTSSSCRTAR